MERAKKIEAGIVKPDEDNMLAICTYMTKVALDGRILDPEAEDYEGSKINQCVRRILEIDRQHTNTAQVVFCDTNTPKYDGKFTVYEDIKRKLVESGLYKPEEIAFVHDAKNDKQRLEIFEKVNNAQIRLIIGSTGKLGTGVNIQRNLIAMHHLDAPYRPSDVEHTKRNKGQPIIRQMALFPYTIINSLVMRILETTKEEILWSSVLLVICSINGNLPNRFIYLF